MKRIFSKNKGDRQTPARVEDSLPYDSVESGPPPQTGSYPLRGNANEQRSVPSTTPGHPHGRKRLQKRGINDDPRLTGQNNELSRADSVSGDEAVSPVEPPAEGYRRPDVDNPELVQGLSKLQLGHQERGYRGRRSPDSAVDVLKAAGSQRNSYNSANDPSSPNAPFNEDVANRNVAGGTSSNRSSYQSPLYQENVAHRNISRNGNSVAFSAVNHEAHQGAGEEPVFAADGRSQVTEQSATQSGPSSNEASNSMPTASPTENSVRRKAAPSPTVTHDQTPGKTHLNESPTQPASQKTGLSEQLEGSRGTLVEGPPDIKESLKGIVDLTDTADTTVAETIAPAVTHEVVTREVHHIREEKITREIHTHDVFHRILPVIDVEVLPTRHFLPVAGGGLVEVDAKDVPGRSKDWILAETKTKIPSGEKLQTFPREFTARQFPGQEGDTKKWMHPDGYEVTEETWIHPPVLETGGQDTGQTWAMHFDNKSSTQIPPVSAVRVSKGDSGSRPGTAS